jgi:hypothetical protein
VLIYPNCLSRFAAVFAALIALSSFSLLSAQTVTSTSLTMSNTSGAVASGGTIPFSGIAGVLTLTATVTSGPNAVTRGTVNFCDATASVCTDVHVVGSAQLTSSGTAVIKFHPGVGIHSYKAVYLGTNTYASSTSATATVTSVVGGGQYPAASLVASTGAWGSYNLTATVMEFGGTSPLTGGISIQDTSNGNAVLATASLGPSIPSMTWGAQMPCAYPPGATSVVAADFNNDGYLDLATAYAANYSEVIYLYQPSLGCYTQSASFTTASYPAGLIVADFNSDGNLDIEFPTSGTNGVNVLLGHGDGTFTMASQAISNLSALFAADFNRDGIPDIAVSNVFNGYVSVLLGNGDGTFTMAPTYSISGPAWVAGGDFNNDGKLDLAVSAGSAVDVLFGNGDGTFTAGPVLQVPISGYNTVGQMATADFNGDGKVDLAVATGTNVVPNPSTINFYLGNGDGTFKAASISNRPYTPGAMKIADFNQDGIADVAVLDNNYLFSVLVGKGDGTFQTPLSAGQNYFNTGWNLGDMDEDGRPDFIYSGYYPPNRVFIFFGLTIPTETASTSPIAIAPAGVGQHLVVSSYSGDATSTADTSNPIVLLGTPPPSATTLALTANGGAVSTVSTGTAIALTATVTSGGSPVRIGQVNFCDATAPSCTDIHLYGSAQLSSDGIASLKLTPAPGSYSYKAVLVENAYGAPSHSGAVALTVTSPAPPPLQTSSSIVQSGQPGNYTLTATVVGAGSLTAPTGSVSFVNTSHANSVVATAPLGSPVQGVAFMPPTTVSMPGSGVLQMASGDFNGDGIQDLVIVDANSMAWTILLGNGDGTYTKNGGPTLSGYLTAVVTGDFNSDGKSDLAISTSGPAFNSLGGLLIFLGNGDGSFTPVTNAVPSGGYSTVFSATDFNGDGKIDLFINNADGSAQVLFGNGDGTFVTGWIGAKATALAVADLNRDGFPDIVAGQWNGATAQVMLGNGDGSFTAVGTPVQSAGSAGVVSAADFNNDGIPDLCVVGGGYSPPTIYLGKGDGTFNVVPGASYPSVNSPSSVIAIDFNHDGKTDIAISNGNSSYGNASNPDVVVLLGNGDGTFTSVTGDTQLNGTGTLLFGAFGANGAPEVAAISGGGVIAFLQFAPTVTETATATSVAPGTPSPNMVAAAYAGDSIFAPSISAATSLTAVVAAPVIVQASGTYNSLSAITITESTPGATVYYSGTGALSNTGNVYTGPIQIYQNGPATIQAYATATGYNQSSTVSASYTFSLPIAAAPTISLPSGQYASPQTVTISAQSGTTILYSTSGAGASVTSTPYTGPITVSTSETLSAIAAGGGYAASKQTAAQYVIASAPSSFIYTFAGTQNWDYLGDGGPPTIASMISPSGTTVDSAGNVFIADIGSNVVRKVAADTGIITTVAGNGTRGYSGDGGPAASAQLSSPISVAVDSAGNLYIADESNRVIRKVAAGTGIITTFAGSTSATGLGEGGPATSAFLGFPTSVTADSVGNIYVVTDFSRVRKVVAATGIITTVAGTGTPGYSGDGGLATNAQINQPYGTAVDSAGNLYIADTLNNVIRKVAANTGIITTVVGMYTLQYRGQPGYAGDGGLATSAFLNQPYGVAVDSTGNLFIADTVTNVIREVTASDGIINTIAGTPFRCAALGGDAGPALGAGLCNPKSISVDRSGNLFVAEQGSYRVRVIKPLALPPTTPVSAPVFSVQSGTYDTTQTLTISDSTPGAEIYVTFDGSTPLTTGEGYHGPIAITGSATVNAIAVAPGYSPSSVTSAAYTIKVPQSTLIFTVVGGTVDRSLIVPNDVAFDSAGNMFIADLGSVVVWKIAAGTGAASIIAGKQNQYCTPQVGVLATDTCFTSPNHIALDGSGNLFISNGNIVYKVSAATGILSAYAGGGFTYNPSYGDGGPATSAVLSSAQGLAFDSAGNLFIADSSHGKIRMVSASTGIITTVAGDPLAPSLGDGGPALSASISGPFAIAFDRAGNLYIADANHYRVRMVSASTGLISTVAGNGLPGDHGDDGPPTAAMVAPKGLAFDAAGNLYIAGYPDKIRKVAVGGNSITTVAGNGYVGYTGDGGPASMAQISQPVGLAFDTSGSLFVAANGNAAVRKLSFLPSPTVTWATPSAITYGTTLSSTQLNATANVPGTFVYSPAGGTVLNAGTQTLSVSFTPTDTTEYTTATASVQLTVNRALPTITWTTPAAIAYGTPLTSVQLNATASVSGTFTYTPTAGTVLPLGSNTLSVAFTPNDAVNYTTVSSTVPIQVNQPAPTITSLTPAIGSAGGAAFTLTVNGAGFTPSSVVRWSNSALTTTYVSGTQLTAQVPAANIASAGQQTVTVINPTPGGGSSNALQYEIDTAGSGSPAFTTNNATVPPGASANYPVTLPSGTTNVSVSCLNLPAGSSCSYSASSSSVSISTSSTTPTGTYQVTIVFTETLPGAAAAWLVPIFAVPLLAAIRHRRPQKLWLALCVVAVLGFAVSISGCGGGGNSGGGNSQPQTHQVTSSATVTLKVQ